MRWSVRITCRDDDDAIVCDVKNADCVGEAENPSATLGRLLAYALMAATSPYGNDWESLCYVVCALSDMEKSSLPFADDDAERALDRMSEDANIVVSTMDDAREEATKAAASLSNNLSAGA